MANALYPLSKAKMLTAGINMSSGTVKVALVDTGVYTYSAAHEFFSSVSAGVVGTPQTLTNKTFTAGVFDADNVTFTAVSGNTCEAIVVYIDTGVEATSPIIMYQDTSVTGLPVTPNGGDIAITFDSGASRIFAL